MKKLLLSLAVAAMSATAFAGEVVETLTTDLFSGITKATTYADVTYTSPLTGITYQGNVAATAYENGPSGYIQLRSSNSKEGIVMTANPKGAVFKSLKVYNGNTTATRNIDVYGETTAYTGPTASQLYATSGNTHQGTKIGSAAVLDNGIVTAEAGTNYTFMGFRSASSSCYLAKVEITYEIAGVTGKKAADLAFSGNSFEVREGETFTAPTLTKATTADVVYSTSDENVADVNATTGAVTIMGVGEAVITAKAAENDEYYAGEASYKITVMAANTIYASALGADFTFEVLSGDLETVWSHDNAFGLKGAAFKNGVHAAEALAISPVIDLTNYKNVILNFQNAFNNYKLNNTMISVADFKDYAFIMAREEGATEWKQIAEPTAPEAFSWNFYDNAPVSLEAYAGKKMQFAYKYVSTAEVAGTWEVKKIAVTGERTGVDVVENFVDDNNAPVVYYNMQGMKVANPTEGMYIRVQGSKSTKVMIRK